VATAPARRARRPAARLASVQRAAASQTRLQGPTTGRFDRESGSLIGLRGWRHGLGRGGRAWSGPHRDAVQPAM